MLTDITNTMPSDITAISATSGSASAPQDTRTTPWPDKHSAQYPGTRSGTRSDTRSGRRLRRDPGTRLRMALDELAGCGTIISHQQTPWASITFSGVRHSFTVLFCGDEEVAVGEEFLAALPDHEFILPGQIVADASIGHVQHELLPIPRLQAEIELLMLDDA